MLNNLGRKCTCCETILLEGESWISWVKKPDNPKLYKKLLGKYGRQITSGYCPDCEKIMRKMIEKMKK